ncbi:MAG: dicarboxylate/amino acid:cation symporter [Chitinophagales bacterium]|nr:dicarboxylate/amino acid:cation symporter [Chitinophagales bacterium]
MTKTKLALHWKIIIGMLLGVLIGYLANQCNAQKLVIEFIQPFGTIFINVLKLIAIPLIVTSLIKGVTDIKDITKLSTLGVKTIGLYILTTVIAISVGLIMVSIIKPGKSVQPETRQILLEQYASEAIQKKENANTTKANGTLQPLVDLFPSNIIESASNNGNMLQIIVVTLFFGIGLILIPFEKAQPVIAFFDGANEVLLKLIDLIMSVAPIGVFALMAAMIVNIPSADVFLALGKYMFTVIFSLLFLVIIIYGFLIRFFVKINLRRFFSAIAPAQLLAFSTASSAATLPLTMERVTEHLGVDDDISSFVLPLGATINMDGTSLYQAVAAVFIAQVLGIDLSFATQLGIIVTATLASIGSAAVPGAGMVMLVIVLEQAGIPLAGIALIFAVDRILDMCRTVTNVTGDATVATLIAKQENLLR